MTDSIVQQPDKDTQQQVKSKKQNQKGMITTQSETQKSIDTKSTENKQLENKHTDTSTYKIDINTSVHTPREIKDTTPHKIDIEQSDITTELPESIKICFMKMNFIIGIEDGYKPSFRTQTYTNIHSLLGNIFRYTMGDSRDTLVVELNSIYRLTKEVIELYREQANVIKTILPKFCKKLEDLKGVYKNDMKVSSQLDIYIHQFRYFM